MAIVGFTGTQKGLTVAQRRAIGLRFELDQPDEVHHGDCIGADAEVHDLAGLVHAHIVVHPPRDPKKRAFLVGAEMRDALPYHDRNAAIVHECDVLFAAPGGTKEQIRSGTWSTMRRAVKAGVPVLAFWPNGQATEWRGEEE